MMVYFFGVIFFLGCVNLVLRIVVDDGVNEFGVEVVFFIKENFYVDDGFKLVFIV